MIRKYEVILVIGADIANPWDHSWLKSRFKVVASSLLERGVLTGRIVFLDDTAQQDGHQIDLATPTAQLPVPTPGKVSQLHEVLTSFVQDGEPRLLVVMSDLSEMDRRAVEQLITDKPAASYLFVMNDSKTDYGNVIGFFGFGRRMGLIGHGQLRIVTPSQPASAIPDELTRLWDR